MSALQRRTIEYVAVATALAIAVFYSLVPPIPQDPVYHNFVDQRPILGLSNFWNVMSNVPFLFAGYYGLTRLSALSSQTAQLARIYSIGLILICFGSAWYHLAPDNGSLVWDRLSMTISFMTMMAFVVGRVTKPEYGLRALWPLIILGLFSVIYWDVTEQAGKGDLRLYAIVQFLPGILIPALLFTAADKFGTAVSRWIWLGLAAYVAAKIAEWQDGGLYVLGNLLSGHSVKHVLAALSSYYFLRAVLASEQTTE
jgi:hypothetical protein